MNGARTFKETKLYASLLMTRQSSGARNKKSGGKKNPSQQAAKKRWPKTFGLIQLASHGLDQQRNSATKS